MKDVLTHKRISSENHLATSNISVKLNSNSKISELLCLRPRWRKKDGGHTSFFRTVSRDCFTLVFLWRFYPIWTCYSNFEVVLHMVTISRRHSHMQKTPWCHWHHGGNNSNFRSEYIILKGEQHEPACPWPGCPRGRVRGGSGPRCRGGAGEGPAGCRCPSSHFRPGNFISN